MPALIWNSLLSAILQTVMVFGTEASRTAKCELSCDHLIAVIPYWKVYDQLPVLNDIKLDTPWMQIQDCRLSLTVKILGSQLYRSVWRTDLKDEYLNHESEPAFYETNPPFLSLTLYPVDISNIIARRRARLDGRIFVQIAPPCTNNRHRAFQTKL